MDSEREIKRLLDKYVQQFQFVIHTRVLPLRRGTFSATASTLRTTTFIAARVGTVPRTRQILRYLLAVRGGLLKSMRYLPYDRNNIEVYPVISRVSGIKYMFKLFNIKTQNPLIYTVREVSPNIPEIIYSIDVLSKYFKTTTVFYETVLKVPGTQVWIQPTHRELRKNGVTYPLYRLGLRRGFLYGYWDPGAETVYLRSYTKISSPRWKHIIGFLKSIRSRLYSKEWLPR